MGLVGLRIFAVSLILILHVSMIRPMVDIDTQFLLRNNDVFHTVI